MTSAPTERQLECLRLSAVMTDKEIARHLKISESTVSHHISAAMRRLGQPTRRAALRSLGGFPLDSSSPIALQRPDEQLDPPFNGDTDGPIRTETQTASLDMAESRTGALQLGRDASSVDGGAPFLDRSVPDHTDRRALHPAGTYAHHPGDARPTGRYSWYRPAPASALARLIIILALAALCALAVPTLLQLVATNQHRWQAADRSIER